jgi:hypothetical protein
MTSSISWLDFSDTDRRKMMEIVSMFKDSETRDELGLGPIRDAFADLLFPGTTTIQTKVHYFLFVPWIYQQLEYKRVSSRDFSGRLKQEETILINALKDEGETLGVIGQLVGASLNRFPSNIYWNGLRQWGIVRFPGSQYEYHRSLDAYYRRLETRPEKDSPEIVENTSNWSQLPPIPGGFPRKAAFRLTKEQAEFLQTRLMHACGDSMLAYLAEFCQPVQEVPYAWLHPQFAEFPERLQNLLNHARNFSEAMHAASLLYNQMLAEEINNPERIEDYRNRIANWHAEVLARGSTWSNWNQIDFWRTITKATRVPGLSERFVKDWLENLLAGGQVVNPSDHSQMRNLVRFCEMRLKGNRSRFRNRRHLEIWSGDAGTGRLDFRWRIARDHTNDIIRALRSEL